MTYIDETGQPVDPPRDPVDKILMVRRTVTPMLWGGLVMLLAEYGVDVGPWLAAHPITLVIAQIALSALIYLVALLLGPRLPWLERVLLSSAQRPALYVDPASRTGVQGDAVNHDREA